MAGAAPSLMYAGSSWRDGGGCALAWAPVVRESGMSAPRAHASDEKWCSGLVQRLGLRATGRTWARDTFYGHENRDSRAPLRATAGASALACSRCELNLRYLARSTAVEPCTSACAASAPASSSAQSRKRTRPGPPKPNPGTHCQRRRARVAPFSCAESAMLKFTARSTTSKRAPSATSPVFAAPCVPRAPGRRTSPTSSSGGGDDPRLAGRLRSTCCASSRRRCTVVALRAGRELSVASCDGPALSARPRAICTGAALVN